MAAKLSRTFLVGPRGEKDKDKIAKGEGGVRTDSQTIKNLVMVLVTTLTALDLYSEGEATKQLAGDIVRVALSQCSNDKEM